MMPLLYVSITVFNYIYSMCITVLTYCSKGTVSSIH